MNFASSFSTFFRIYRMLPLFLVVLGWAEDSCESYYVCEDVSCNTKVCVDNYNPITEDDALPLWLILCGSQVFLMQLGFSNLEAGSVSRRNVQNIIFKNIMDACLGSIIWFCFGYGVAWGEGEVIGGSEFFEVTDNTNWYFQWAFCVTASTIVSGAVAERMKLEAYFIYTIVINAFIYPVTVHWFWSGEGYASAGNGGATAPAIDFAGSGVVHMVGGLSGLMGAYMVGPRTGRFEKVENAQDFTTHSIPLQAFGTFVLWFGWYGFNCGSTVAVRGRMETAALVAVTTTLAAATGGLTTAFVARFFTKKWNIGLACNGILAGLVSITAPCSVVKPGYAIIIGFIGGLVYYGFSNLMITLKIDDPLDAAAVHGFCGFWGVISVAIFTTKEDILNAGYDSDVAGISLGTRFGNQLAAAVTITVWTICMSGIMFLLTDKIIGIRTESGSKIGGLDDRDFGIAAYENPTMDKNDSDLGMAAEESAPKKNDPVIELK
jgi:Amt family ammonium transporter